MQVKPGFEEAFENTWKQRESRLHEFKGFIRFMMLKGDTPGEYMSQTLWEDKESFQTWMESQSVSFICLMLSMWCLSALDNTIPISRTRIRLNSEQ